MFRMVILFDRSLKERLLIHGILQFFREVFKAALVDSVLSRNVISSPLQPGFKSSRTAIRGIQDS